MMEKSFWFLDAPATVKRAELVESQTHLATVFCPVNAGHQRPGQRLTSPEFVLSEEPRDFVWTWESELLVRPSVVDLFRSMAFTGFDLVPAKVRFKVGDRQPPQLWRLVINGWGGVARRESGIHLDELQSCSACGLLVYTALQQADNLFDETNWDGSDLFMIWPLPRYVFLTERVADAIRDSHLTGVEIRRQTSLRTSGGFSPGRLAYWMGLERAQSLGAGLGIA